MIEVHDQFLWRAAAHLLEIDRLLDGKPQEVSANYDAAAQSCPTFADLGMGGMRALGVALPAQQVEAGVRLLAASVGKAIEREEPFLNLILPNATLLNAITARLLELSPDERLGIIEDEPELQIRASNSIRRLVRGKADMRRHVREMLRMRPDRIIVGEVRGAEALDLLKAWNTGHSGFTTIHANSANAALLRLESLMQEGGVPANPRLIAESVDVLIFISRRPDGARRIREMVRVEGCAPDGGYHLR
jgi:Flp pilus assembly CpaF family ATPase